ncbi:MAG TPA: tetratricopeptide repeat protein, partial [Planctomycetota bacterium]|nr:tetratricopeptide repeat protein [Planctomycetota bacterium]
LVAGLAGDGREQVMRAALQTGDDALLDGLVDGWATEVRDDPSLLGEIGTYHLRTGDREAALATYGELFTRAEQGQLGWLPGVPAELIESEPDYVRREMDRLRLSAGTQDELWGDVADTYWALGLRDDARACWERALEIDPTDSEWIGNLRALRAGRDPR